MDKINKAWIKAHPNRRSASTHYNNIGNTYGYLIIVGVYLGKSDYFYKCKCKCGNVVKATTSNILLNKIISCGCYFKSEEFSKVQSSSKIKHGYDSRYTSKKIRLRYSAYKAMLSRCYNKNNEAYPNYGGRGIRVCKRWRGEHGFDNYLEDMGFPPAKGMSIDRKNNDEGYSPSNCRWATDSQQMKNRRRFRTPEKLYGRKFGKLTVISEDKIEVTRREKVICQCDCGNVKVVNNRYNLLHGYVKSCGCLRSESLRVRYDKSKRR